jgi:hypothetical protein
MLNSKILGKAAACSLAVALCGAQSVFAHTTIKDQATEGKTAYNALQIGHGCENPTTGDRIPVTAQSVVFPTVNPVVTRSDGTATTLDAEISDTLGLAGKVDVVQDRSVFKAQDEVYDATGNVIGFNSTNGNLQTNLRGLVPFRFTPVTFQKSSCAKRLLVKVAIADICKKAFPPKPGTANLWIPANTTKFKNKNIDGIGAPATLTINRDLTANPLDASCGEGYDVTVTPSNEDVDANLPIKGWGKK